jgi:hypothetical protein
VGTHIGSTVRSNRWRRIGPWAILVSSLVAVAAVVGSSLSPEHYYFRSAEARRAFVLDPRDVATAFLLSAGEGAVLCLIVCIGPGRRLWRRLFLALVVFVPWLFVMWDQVGTHVPMFLMINALWVTLIVIFLTGGLLVLSAIHLRHRIRPQDEEEHGRPAARGEGLS